jgi:hypothetical protein
VHAEEQLDRLRRSVGQRALRLGYRVARPVLGLLVLAGVIFATARYAPTAIARWLAAYQQAPTLVLSVSLVLTLVGLAVFVRLRFRWRWLTPTRARWLGAIKLLVLALLSLAMLIYLKVWERLHRIRVFP